MLRPGQYNKAVTLSRAPQTTPDTDGYDEALSPENWWVSIEPVAPATMGDGSRIQGAIVRGRYHPQVTVDTCITYGTRKLFVKGVQNVNEANVELVCYCEEAIP